MGKFSFGKGEKLKKEKDIKELFDKGSSFYLFPFRVLALKAAGAESQVNQVLISVSKRNFKKATERNRIKRQIREAYRLNKHLLTTGHRSHIGFIYSHKEILTTREISDKMVHVLKRLDKWASAQAGSS